MDRLLVDVVDQIYRNAHEMNYCEVMQQLKLYRVHTVFNVSLDFVEYAQFCINGSRKQCIDINNINASPNQILNLIHHDNDNNLNYC